MAAVIEWGKRKKTCLECGGTGSVEGDCPWLTWNNGTVPRMAQRIYEERDWRALPILADALEDSGCDNAAILDHLRSDGPFCRGDFALDILLWYS